MKLPEAVSLNDSTYFLERVDIDSDGDYTATYSTLYSEYKTTKVITVEFKYALDFVQKMEYIGVSWEKDNG